MHNFLSFIFTWKAETHDATKRCDPSRWQVTSSALLLRQGSLRLFYRCDSSDRSQRQNSLATTDFHMSHKAICCSNLSWRRVAAICRIVTCVSAFELRPRLHVFGYFWIRNFFFPDTATVHTHPANLTANPNIFKSALLVFVGPRRNVSEHWDGMEWNGVDWVEMDRNRPRMTWNETDDVSELLGMTLFLTGILNVRPIRSYYSWFRTIQSIQVHSSPV